MQNDPTGSFTISSTAPLDATADGRPPKPKPLPGLYLGAAIMAPPLGAPIEYHRSKLSRHLAEGIMKNPAFFSAEPLSGGSPSILSVTRISVECLVLTRAELKAAMEEAYAAGYLAGQHSANYRG